MLEIERRRTTNETDVCVKIDFDGSGETSVETGIPFFDHLLSSFARHGRFDLDLQVNGDLEIDDHHVVEDVGIVLGDVVHEAQRERVSIERFGSAIVPMDDALIMMAIDLGGRTYVDIKIEFKKEHVGSFVLDNVKHFLRSLADAGCLNLHTRKLAGEDDHHVAEATFKALGISLARAIQKDPALAGSTPSTKGNI
jgi:imidazoleglycerol-phosphate dehydratase